MRKITADYICPVSSDPVSNAVIITDEEGRIQEIGQRRDFDPAELEIYQGYIVPGFINAHCHLELSHMKGMVPTGTGLIPFIRDVVSKRDVGEEKILDAIRRAEDEMLENGIVAVGDISNVHDTFKTKVSWPIAVLHFR